LILLFVLRYFRWSVLFRLTNQNVVYISYRAHALYMPLPSNSSRLNRSNNLVLKIRILDLFIVQFSPASCHLIPLGPSVLNIFFTNTLTCVPPLTWQTK
jgi:hypothetical protein